MLAMAVHTFRERWTLFVGTLLCVTLGVALVESSVLLLQAAKRLEAATQHSTAASDVEVFMGITLMVSAFLSVFIIGSTFAFTVNERRRDLALLRLSGATRRQVRLLLAGESVVVGMVASAVGVVLGLVLVPVQLALLRRIGMTTDLLDVRLSSVAVAVAVGSGIGLSLLGVSVASRRAARVRPLDALRDIDDAAKVMTWGRWTWGLLSAAVTVLGFVLAQASSDPLVAILVAVNLIFSASIALQQLSPLAVPLVARLGVAIARRGVEGELAYANLIDGRRRAATTAGPLITLIGIVIGLYGAILSQSAAQVRDLEITTSADLVVMISGTDTAGIAAVDGVEAVAPLTKITGLASYPGSGEEHAKRVDLVVTDPAAYRVVMKPRLREGTLATFHDDTLIANGDSDGPIPANLAELRVRTGYRWVTLNVTARTATSLADYSAAILPLDQVDPAVVAGAPTQAMVAVEPGTDPTAVRRSLITAGYHNTTTTAAWAAGDQAKQADLNRSLTLGLAGLGAFYALIAVINAVALAAAARTREFAVAQVSGMTRTQVIRTSVVEALGVGVIGVALGCLAALTCLLSMRRGFDLVLGEPVVVVPWVALGGLAFVSLAAVTVTAGAGTWLATRTPPIALAATRE